MTSNRDEAPHRNAIELRHQSRDTQELIYPVDPAAGGSWFCISNHDKIACLLNGAYVPFTPDPRYTQSRGIVLLDLVANDSIHTFLKTYDLMQTAPFTAVIASHRHVHELVWDGIKTHVREMDPGAPAFWSSVTLYPEEVRLWRKALFQGWVALHHDFDQETIMHFHQYGSKGDPWNGFVMNREERVKTLSITSAKRSTERIELHHADLTSGTSCIETLNLASSHVDKD